MKYFGKYVASGSAALLVQLAVLTLMINAFHVDPVAASTAGFIVACVVNYSLQHLLVFSSDRSMAVTASRYVAVTTVMLGVNALVFAAFNRLGGLSPVVAQILATGCVFIANFVCNRHFTFAAAAK